MRLKGQAEIESYEARLKDAAVWRQGRRYDAALDALLTRGTRRLAEAVCFERPAFRALVDAQKRSDIVFDVHSRGAHDAAFAASLATLSTSERLSRFTASVRSRLDRMFPEHDDGMLAARQPDAGDDDGGATEPLTLARSPRATTGATDANSVAYDDRARALRTTLLDGVYNEARIHERESLLGRVARTTVAPLVSEPAALEISPLPG